MADSLELMVNRSLYDDWRLPSYESNELGHLYVDELKNSASVPSNYGPFSNLHYGGANWDSYWTGSSAGMGMGAPMWWAYWFYGDGVYGFKWAGSSYGAYALAIHDGNVGGTVATPEPATMLLLGSGLAALRRRSKQA